MFFNDFNTSYITSTGSVILESATPIHYISTSIPEGKRSEGHNVTILVIIEDTTGSSHPDKFIVKVHYNFFYYE